MGALASAMPTQRAGTRLMSTQISSVLARKAGDVLSLLSKIAFRGLLFWTGKRVWGPTVRGLEFVGKDHKQRVWACLRLIVVPIPSPSVLDRLVTRNGDLIPGRRDGGLKTLDLTLSKTAISCCFGQ